MKASPGVPLSKLANSNGDLMNRHGDFVTAAVVERLFLLSQMDEDSVSNFSPEKLVEMGLCDPVRLFVKQEPHPISKITEGRFRLISSVSIIDQIVERMLFGPQNSLEISEWTRVPSKPGMGLTLRWQQQALFDDLRFKHLKCPAAEADISGFDWTVQNWELWADVEMRIALGGFPKVLARTARNRFRCFMASVFQLSDGRLLAQNYPGIMKSGSYCTSSTNSRIRCLMAELIGSPWCIAMGDDSIEGFVEHAQEKYARLGHKCKMYVVCKTDLDGSLLESNFCSHVIRRDKCFLDSWAKTLFRHLEGDNLDYSDLEAELRGSPKWWRIKQYLDVRNSTSADKTIEPNVCETDKTAATTSSAAHGSERNFFDSEAQGQKLQTKSSCPWEEVYGSCVRSSCRYFHIKRD